MRDLLAGRRRSSLACLAFGLFGALASGAAAAPTPTPAAKLPAGPPFDILAPTPHRLTGRLDTKPARDLITLLAGGEGATAALRRLKESPAVNLGLEVQGIRPDDFYGRVVASAAGTPDPLLASYAKSAGQYAKVLDALETDGPALVQLCAARVASLLPSATPVTAELVIVPFLGTGGFAEIVAAREGEELYLIADLPRLTGESLTPPPPREVLLALLREVASEAWKELFTAHFRKPPAWTEQKEPNFEALLSLTVATGPPALFLIPDEFYPIGLLLDEPIARAFARWNKAVEALQDPARKEPERQSMILDATRGDFWRRYGTVVGAYMAEALIRGAGRNAYLDALARGPRAVARLYLERSKGAKVPQLGPAARKALDQAPPTPTPTIALSSLAAPFRAPARAATR